MTLNDFLTIIAILLAPIFAVQVQKRIEIFREERERKLRIFKTLMATRAATVSPEHVQALNMIDLEFQGRKFKSVTDAWKTYLDHLASYPKEGNEAAQQQWTDKRIDRLTALLMEMGKCLDYEFDEVHVRKGIYSPEAHNVIENENLLARRGLIRLLYGESALKMNIESIPVSEEDAQEQKLVRNALLDVLKGNEAISIRTEPDNEKSKSV